MQLVSKNEEPNGNTSRKVNSEWSTRKTINTLLIVDFITKLLVVTEKNAILVIYDRLLKIAYFVAITEETSAEGLARLFRNNM